MSVSDRRAWALPAILALALALVSCQPREVGDDPPLSRDAKIGTVEMLLEDLAAERSPADGGGRAWLAEPPAEPVPAGSRQVFEIVYEAGPLGVEEGGAIVLQPSPFWGWDAPQNVESGAPGFTEVSTETPQVEIELEAPAPHLLSARIRGRKLEHGEQIRLRYGAGTAGARVDRYSEAGAPIWIAVDGDGDGVRSLVKEYPRVDVGPGPPSQAQLTLPSTARPGDTVRLTLAVLDAVGNAGVDFQATVTLTSPPGLAVPEQLRFDGDEKGMRSVEVAVEKPGVYRLSAAVDGNLLAESNPLVVEDGIPRVLWGDLHGHSMLSDGTGTPEEYFRYARDAASLDFVALTDHDHWGMRFMDEHGEMWAAVQDVARMFNDEGRFVALAGYEWTSWLHGHRHVLYFGECGPIFSSLDPAYETPPQLWEALAGHSALTVAHHSAGGPISTNWYYVPDPDIEPVTEVVSAHGSSEAFDTPGRIYNPVEGNFVRDELDRGLRFGFIGSGDGHDGHPGLSHLASPSGGLAAIFSEENSREAILRALKARRVYATNGRRIWLRMWLDDQPMGSNVPPTAAPSAFLRFAVAATAPIDRVDIVRSGQVVIALPGDGRTDWSERLELQPFERGEYAYVRVFQVDGGVAWASPVYVGEPVRPKSTRPG